MVNFYGQFPILFASTLGIYIGGSFIYGTLISQTLGHTLVPYRDSLAWFALGLLFILFSILHAIKFAVFKEPEDKTRLMFPEPEESGWLIIAYGTLFFLLSGVSATFFWLHFDMTTSPLEEISMALLTMVNFVMGFLKYRSLRIVHPPKKYKIAKPARSSL